MAELNLDDTLDFENDLYSKGYEEGVEAATNEQFLEGKIYGLQTGFQRFLIVGYIEGLLQEWRLQNNENKQLQLQLDQLSKLLEGIQIGNSDHSVAMYEKAVLAARNKVRVIASLTKTTDKVAGIDRLMQEVGGTLAAEKQVDEMW